MALILGGALIVLYAPLVAAPDKARTLLLAFPRHKLTGYALTALGLFWLATLILPMDLGYFSFLKPYVYVVGPVLFIVICVFLQIRNIYMP